MGEVCGDVTAHAVNPLANIKLFNGTHTVRLDEKKRLTIPAPMRFEGEGASAYMALLHPALGAIMVQPPQMVAKIYAAAEQITLSDPAKMDALGMIGELSQMVSCDKAGRVILNDDLLSRARIERDAVIRGSVTYFRIQSPTPPAPDRESEDARRLLSALAALGL